MKGPECCNPNVVLNPVGIASVEASVALKRDSSSSFQLTDGWLTLQCVTFPAAFYSRWFELTALLLALTLKVKCAECKSMVFLTVWSLSAATQISTPLKRLMIQYKFTACVRGGYVVPERATLGLQVWSSMALDESTHNCEYWWNLLVLCWRTRNSDCAYLM